MCQEAFVGLRCPHCASIRVHVMQTFRLDGAIMRRRKCRECTRLFLTYEIEASLVPTDPKFDFLYRRDNE